MLIFGRYRAFIPINHQGLVFVWLIHFALSIARGFAIHDLLKSGLPAGNNGGRNGIPSCRQRPIRYV
jgi:hypothetical protein